MKPWLPRLVALDAGATLFSYGVSVLERGVTADAVLILPLACMALCWAVAKEREPTGQVDVKGQPTRRERKAAHREAIAKRLATFATNKSGVAAIEMAVIAPLLCCAILGGVDLYQVIQQRQAVNFAATAAAAIGGRNLKKDDPATCDPAKAEASAAFDAAVQSGIFMFGSQATLGSVDCVSGNSAMQVTVSATSNALFPLYGLPTFTATLTVRG